MEQNLVLNLSIMGNINNSNDTIKPSFEYNSQERKSNNSDSSSDTSEESVCTNGRGRDHHVLDAITDSPGNVDHIKERGRITRHIKGHTRGLHFYRDTSNTKRITTLHSHIIPDRDRVEEPWDSALEQYMINQRDKAEFSSVMHTEAGYYYKVKKNTWGPPTIIIPAVMAVISPLVASYKNEQANIWVNSIAYIIIAIVAGIYSWFKYAEKTEQHFNFGSYYNNIFTDIDLELNKRRPSRIQADLFMQKICIRMDNLTKTEPVIPKIVISNCQKDWDKQHNPDGNGEIVIRASSGDKTSLLKSLPGRRMFDRSARQKSYMCWP